MATDATAIIAIPEALLETAATRHFEGTLDLAELAAGPDTYTFAAPVTWSVEATNTGDAILIQGTAAGDATTQCARCLEDVTYGLEGDIEGYFLIGGEEEAETPEDMEGDEFDFLPDNRKIDLVPLIVAASVSGLDQMTVSAIAGRQLPILALIVPLWVCVTMCGFKRSLEVLPAIIVGGVCFAGAQFLLANYHGPTLPDIGSAIATIVGLVLLLKVWKPSRTFRFEG